MTTYPIEVDRRPADPPTRWVRIVLGATAAGLALLLAVGIATGAIGYVAHGIATGREVVDSSGTTADRIAHLEAVYGGGDQ